MAAGFVRLEEQKAWSVSPGGSYYATRNGSSIIAFRVSYGDFDSVMLTAAHTDSPTFRIKGNAELCDKVYVRLSTEKYGGMICPSWLDRPLSVAGRVLVRAPGGAETRLVDLGGTAAIIPNTAIHLARNVNDGMKYDPAVDMIPLFGAASSAGSFSERVAEVARCGARDTVCSPKVLP